MARIVDKYAEGEMHPRCICDSFELTFIKNMSGVMKAEVYALSSTGYGSSMNISITKTK